MLKSFDSLGHLVEETMVLYAERFTQIVKALGFGALNERWTGIPLDGERTTLHGALSTSLPHQQHLRIKDGIGGGGGCGGGGR